MNESCVLKLEKQTERRYGSPEEQKILSKFENP